jgi:hypothetical protein
MISFNSNTYESKRWKALKLTRLRADKFLYAGIIYAKNVYNSATETKKGPTLMRKPLHF